MHVNMSVSCTCHLGLFCFLSRRICAGPRVNREEFFLVIAVAKVPCLQSLCSTSKGCSTETANTLAIVPETMELEVKV